MLLKRIESGRRGRGTEVLSNISQPANIVRWTLKLGNMFNPHLIESFSVDWRSGVSQMSQLKR